jgi:hypothetical protein
LIEPLGAQGADLAVQVLRARGHPRMADLAHLFRSRFSLQAGVRLLRHFGIGGAAGKTHDCSIGGVV